MATTTTNLGLKKPASSDYADIGDINDNMDLIDAGVVLLDQGVANAGKFMIVDSSGKVAATTVPLANGGEF